jgi:hypothetical protein
MRRLTTREEETGQEYTREDTERMRTRGRGAAFASRNLGVQAAGGARLASAERGMGANEETNTLVTSETLKRRLKGVFPLKRRLNG